MSDPSKPRRNYLAGCMVFAAGTFAVIFIVVLVFWVLNTEVSGLPSLGRRIALAELDGPIEDTRDLVEELDRYGDDGSVRAVVLRIDSPGGLVGPSQELYEAVRRLREKKKPVVVSMGSLCASGGYYVACAADTLVANPGTLTASIGVIMEIPTAAELLRKVGVKFEIVKSGKAKSVGTPWKDMTPEERAVLQSLIDDTYGQFVDAVAAERGLDRSDVLAVADGRPLTGQQALRAGLVDKLGDLQAAIDVAAEMAGISGKPTIVKKTERENPFVGLLRRVLDQKWAGSSILTGGPTVRLEYRLF